MSDFALKRNSFGKLLLTDSNGNSHESVVPVHAFPLSAPDFGISLLSADGHELIWIERLQEVSEETQKLIREELQCREFVPEILRILSVSTFATPSIWQVETTRGNTRMVLKGEEDIRRIDRTSLLIADSNSINYLIRDVQKLDRQSRKILDRFL